MASRPDERVAAEENPGFDDENVSSASPYKEENGGNRLILVSVIEMEVKKNILEKDRIDFQNYALISVEWII